MEKLQAAIELARKNRSIGSSSMAPASARDADAVRAAWEALPQHELKPRVLSRHRVVANVRGPGRNAIDMLRTRLLNLCKENGWKRVMITSPTPACGKTTLSANLALALQRQSEMSTLLLDFDLPNASIGKTLGIKPAHDVGELLTGQVSAAEQMVRIGDNLAVSASKGGSGAYSEVLKSSQAQRRIEALEAEFAPDIKLFDFPPFFANDDTIAAARFIDCAIIVGAAEQTSVAEIDATERDLSQYISIAGVVLNKFRTKWEKSSYDYPYPYT